MRSRGRTRRQTPDGFEQRLLARARAAGFTSDDRIVVGFSGGRDSLALAAALRWVQASLGVEPVLVHVDHRLRASSGEEATRAASLAESLNLEFQVVAVSTSPTDVHPGVGVEEAARRERYRSLFAVAERCGARAVATAHHRGDQAETVLLHLLRGGGVHGAAGMAERSPSPVPAADLPRDISPENLDKRAVAVAAVVERAARGHRGLRREAGLGADRGSVQQRYDVAAQRVAP